MHFRPTINDSSQVSKYYNHSIFAINTYHNKKLFGESQIGYIAGYTLKLMSTNNQQKSKYLL